MTRLRTHVFVALAREVRGGPATFAPTTATLVTGEHEAVLIDTQFIDTEVAALGEFIENTGKRLTTIYITHAHADHYLGLDALTRRFPDARAATTAAVAAAIEATLDDQIRQWRDWFGPDITAPAVLPTALDGDVIDLEGHPLRVIEIGQGDIAPSTVVHIPSIDTVIAGDIAYNRIHPMLAFTGPDEWKSWIDSIDTIRQLAPRTVIAGHKAPGADDNDVDAILDGTRDYIRDFHDVVTKSTNADQVVAALTAKYPDYGNVTTLVVSARAAFASTG
ncbi:MBL fold metallo-hydrolase [Nocardia bovistercoris]|uniref:MBL fold metallo-hydrolase n=1 Tax=Nocardia bovistercoris TaxID=2785916 RepID=A0A931N4S5_9NOCA|nr:MBL fold metallo-hydrolase [Nocardia bovistercoris]MBH0777923.1 MBL fold metallo-hydrolase [Nocardia bovistercoris]